MLKIQKIKLGNLAPNIGQIPGLPTNPRKWSEEDVERIAKSLRETPELFEARPIIAVPFDGTNVILGGNLRFEGATKNGDKDAPVVLLPADTPVEKLKEIVIKDNGNFGAWDVDALLKEWDNGLLNDWGVPGKIFAKHDGGQDWGERPDIGIRGALGGKFVIPPFTVLNTRSGDWKTRKALWRGLIGDNGESRENTLSNGGIGTAERVLLNKKNADGGTMGVSIFDPVLAEIIVKWFGIENGRAFDCFAGDSVFGYVSANLGQDFTGIELRAEQCALNNKRVEGMSAKYICDDGQNVAKHLDPESQDLLFSCPPYFDLEVYSDLPNDASNQSTYADFLAILSNAFKASVGLLKQNRFAVIVVGDVRRKDGFYYDFPGDVKRIFKEAGCGLYNELILVEPLGSLPQRVTQYMNGRKVGKCHQNVLVFYKGDPDKISKTFKRIEYASEDLESFGMD